MEYIFGSAQIVHSCTNRQKRKKKKQFRGYNAHNFVVDILRASVLFFTHDMRTHVPIIKGERVNGMEREFSGSFGDFLVLKRKTQESPSKTWRKN